MAWLSDLTINNTTDGRRLPRFTTIIGNIGAASARGQLLEFRSCSKVNLQFPSQIAYLARPDAMLTRLTWPSSSALAILALGTAVRWRITAAIADSRATSEREGIARRACGKPVTDRLDNEGGD